MKKFIKEFESRFKKEANPDLEITEDYISFSLNNREILNIINLSTKEQKEVLNLIYNNFDFSYYLEFENIEEIKTYFNNF